MKRIIDAAYSLKEETVRLRRDFHKYPESGFCEFRTASIIIDYLLELGYDVKYGKAVINENALLGVPSDSVLQSEKQRAVSEGASPEYVDSLDGGATAIVATIQGSGGNGKTVAFRFDMDCNELNESCKSDHRPYTEGFASVHSGRTHACGHDGHAAIGLTLARILAENSDMLSGKVKLIFQPAEEGVRGAKAMAEAGVVDDVDYFFAGHLGMSANRSGVLYTSTCGFLCAAKFDAEFFGQSSHAGVAPEEGRNALMAAAQATLSMHSISRHGSGSSRINVGVMTGGSGRNVIPDYAKIMFETRGETDEINSYMIKRAKTVISSSAQMYDVDYKLSCVGYASSFVPDHNFSSELALFAESCKIYEEVHDYADMRASEDCTVFMNRVCANGGRASYLLFGTDLASNHHTHNFDFDENTLTDASAFLALLAIKYAK